MESLRGRPGHIFETAGWQSTDVVGVECEFLVVVVVCLHNRGAVPALLSQNRNLKIITSPVISNIHTPNFNIYAPSVVRSPDIQTLIFIFVFCPAPVGGQQRSGAPRNGPLRVALRWAPRGVRSPGPPALGIFRGHR